MNELITGTLMLAGSFFCLSAAIGIVRLPDVYSRMHAASKVGTFGLGFLFIAMAVFFPGLEITTRAVAGICFFVLTAPIAAHLLARAAYGAGVVPWENNFVDQLSGRYKRETKQLEGFPFDKNT